LGSLFLGIGPSVAPSHALGQSIPATVPPQARQDRGFGSFVADAFSYPFRGDGVIILIVGTISFTIITFPSLFSLWLTIAGWGYLMLMPQQVIHGTALGEATVPRWPDFDGFGELAVKFLQWMLAVVVCLGGAIILLAKSQGSGDRSLMVYALLVDRSILRVPGHHILTPVVFVGLGLVKRLTGKLGDIRGAVGYCRDRLGRVRRPLVRHFPGPRAGPPLLRQPAEAGMVLIPGVAGRNSCCPGFRLG
jgi:hypothetical protein